MHTFGRPKEHAEPKQASFGEYALDSRGSSPPLTSSLHSRNSASSAQESAYLRQASALRWTRLLLAIVTAATAATILGCASHVLKSYNDSALGGEWYLPLWPVNVDVKPLLAELVPACIVVGTTICYVIIAVIPSPRSRFLIQNLVFMTASVTGVIITLFSIVYSHVVTYHIDAGARETLATWTCSLYRNAQSFYVDGSTLQLGVTADDLMPSGFRRLCHESQVARWLMVALLVLELLSLAAATIGLLGEQRISRVRRSKYQDEKSSFA